MLSRELDDSDEMVRLLWRYGQGQELSELERGAAKQQLVDLAKAIPCLGIFLLPGGLVLLPLAARILPFDMFPRAFSGGPKPPLLDAEEPEHFRIINFYSMPPHFNRQLEAEHVITPRSYEGFTAAEAAHLRKMQEQHHFTEQQRCAAAADIRELSGEPQLHQFYNYQCRKAADGSGLEQNPVICAAGHI